jgi:chromosome segregation ATPase
MSGDETNELKTDIALIKRDISQIESILSKLDTSIEKITSLSKTIAIQERIVEQHEKRLDTIDEKITRHQKDEEEFRNLLRKQMDSMATANREYIDDLKKSQFEARERRHAEVMNSIETLHKELRKKNNEQDSRLSALENWRWWLMGIGSVIIAGLGYFSHNFFG